MNLSPGRGSPAGKRVVEEFVRRGDPVTCPWADPYGDREGFLKVACTCYAVLQNYGRLVQLCC